MAKDDPANETMLRELKAEFDGFRKLMEERDRLYTERAAASEKAIMAALASADKLASQVSAASEKAIAKAEAAQAHYNATTNEFRGQLNDQANRLMPRTETESILRQQREVMEQTSNELRAADERLRGDLRTAQDQLMKAISDLRESRSQGEGSDKTYAATKASDRWFLTIIVALATAAIAAYVAFGPN